MRAQASRDAYSSTPTAQIAEAQRLFLLQIASGHAESAVNKMMMLQQLVVETVRTAVQVLAAIEQVRHGRESATEKKRAERRVSHIPS